MSEGVDAAIFYVSGAALAGGVIRAGRAEVERRVRDRFGIVLAAGGLVGLSVAAVLFVFGPRTVLPF